MFSSPLQLSLGHEKEEALKSKNDSLLLEGILILSSIAPLEDEFRCRKGQILFIFLYHLSSRAFLAPRKISE